MITLAVAVIVLIFLVAILRIAFNYFNVPAPVVQIVYLVIAFMFVMAVLASFGVVSPSWIMR